MGMLIDGKWDPEGSFVKAGDGGHFKRVRSGFRNWVTKDGSAGPSGEGGFKAEADRYHLYVANACPWAHRTVIFRELKGLSDLISVSVVDPKMSNETGWQFTGGDGSTLDPINNAKTIWQVYVADTPDLTARATVPILWDKQTGKIVSNESAEIIRMFNSAFDDLTGNCDDYYPIELRSQIDAINERVYTDINNGVYKSGFATNQEAYDGAVAALFDSLDWIENILNTKPYLVGDTITEADWRLFTTLVRFDAVYYSHFKCARRRIADYPALSAYLEKLYAHPGIADTVNMEHIRTHYFWSHETINPTRIVPTMPDLPFLRTR